MLTPNGQSADKIEKVMLLLMWANTLQEERALQPSNLSLSKRMITAGVGKPTYPVNQHTIASHLFYWQNIDDLSKEWHFNSETMQQNTAIDYGDPRGDKASKLLMAEAMSAWYESEIKPEHVLFTIGGIGALHTIFETFHTLYEEIPGYRILTPFPHYSAYANDSLHRLHPIEVMSEPGYKLTSQRVLDSIKEAYLLAKVDQGLPKAILICNPSNPLGNIVDEEELRKIADILRDYPDLYIIFDEAYAEMCYTEMPSFLKIAPDLKNRTIIMRSATKALSAAGERMAVLLIFDQLLMHEVLNKNIRSFIHAPRSAQMAYAHTMVNLSVSERENVAAFYKKKVDYVMQRLHAMGAAMPDPFYHVEATFYVLGDFSALFGLELPDDTQRALQKTGKVSTGEDLAYYLLFEDAIMITPLSYFGLPKDSGVMRITCSGNEKELKELMDRLEHRLAKAKQQKWGQSRMALLKKILA